MTEWEKFEIWLDAMVGSGAASRIVAAMQNSGWREPARVIDDHAELRALPEHTVVRDRLGDVAVKGDEPDSWSRPGTEIEGYPALPATVLWESGDPR